MSNNKSKFYVVATPIGNLDDFSFRAVEILKSVDFILAEDTRVSKKLLKYFEINIESNQIFSYNSFSSQEKNNKIIEELKNGKNIALISDAGTPTISDPGFKIISEIQEKLQKKNRKEVEIISIPGPCALISALSVSGISSAQFVFYGFFPRKKGRKTLIEEIKNSQKTSIFYESPHRLLKTLQLFSENLTENRKIFIARELTKLYEEKIFGSPQEVLEFFEKNSSKVKGEFVIIVSGL